MKQDAVDHLQKGGADGVRDRLDQDIGKAKGGNGQASGAQNARAGQQQGAGTQTPPGAQPGGAPQSSQGGGTQQQGSSQAGGAGQQQGPGTTAKTGQQPGASSKQPRFKLHAFDAITLSTTPNYRVMGFIPGVGLVVVWGPPKCGKSFWMFDLMMHIALGWEYRSHKVKQGPVVYCAVEGGHGFRRRIEAWRLHYAARFHGPVPFWLIDVPIDLVKDHKTLIADIRETAGVVPAAVVIDTLNRSLNGSESDDEDMADYIRAADAIRIAFNCVTPIVHHCGTAGTRPRGHTSLSGACDAQISVARDDTNDSITTTVEYMKDGEAAAVATSELKVIDLGPDDDGNKMTSCVIVPLVGAAAGASTNKPGKKLTPLQIAALRALTDCLADLGKVPPASNHIPSAVPCVTLDEWREYLFRHSVINRTSSGHRKQFQRLHVVLRNAGKIGIWDEFVWTV